MSKIFRDLHPPLLASLGRTDGYLTIGSLGGAIVGWAQASADENISGNSPSSLPPAEIVIGGGKDKKVQVQ